MSSRIKYLLCYCWAIFLVACGGSDGASEDGLSKDFWRQSVTQTGSDDASAAYAVGGSILGLDGQRLTIRLNDEETLVINGDDPQFLFNKTLGQGVQYKIDIVQNETSLNCRVDKGNGIVTSGNISDIVIYCDDQPVARNIESFSNITVDYPLPVVQWAFKVADRSSGNGVNSITLDDLLIQENGKDLSLKESFLELEKLQTTDGFSFTFHTAMMLDVSSSLTQDDIVAMKVAVKDLLRDPVNGVSRLSPNQLVSISTFDSRVRSLASATNNLDTLLEAVDAITLGTSSTNLFGAIFEGVNKWDNVSNLNAVETGALIVVTDGQDTAGLVTEAQAIIAAEGKSVFALAVGGDTDTEALSRIAGTEGVFTLDSFSDISSTLSQVEVAAESIDDGVYLLSYVTPKRAGSHELSIEVYDPIGCDNNETQAVSVLISNCSNKIKGVFNADGLNDISPKFVLLEENPSSRKIVLTAKTYWNSEPSRYQWEVFQPEDRFNVSDYQGQDTTSLTLELKEAQAGGSIVVNVTDMSLGETLSNTIFVGTGLVAESSTGRYEVSDNAQSIVLSALSFGGSLAADYEWSIADDSIITMSGNSGEFVTLTRVPGHSQDQTTVVTVTDTSNGFSQQYSILNRATVSGDPQFTVSGKISGLDGERVVLSLNDTENLILEDGKSSFVFSTMLASGASYNVGISSENSKVHCRVTNSSGFVSLSNISNVDVVCEPKAWNLQSFSELNIEAPQPIIQWAFRVSNRYNGQGIDNLELKDLRVEEDSQTLSLNESFLTLEKLTANDQIESRFHTAIMLDISSSLSESDVALMKEAVLDLIRDPLTGYSRLAESQQVSISTFDSRVRSVVPLTNDLQQLISGINGISLGSPSTNLYGAIIAGVEQWDNRVSLSEVETGALIIVTDGRDTAGLNSENEAINVTQSKDVFAVAVGEEADTGSLERIAGLTRVFTTSSFSELSTALNQVRVAAESIDQGLYSLLYMTPKRAGDHSLSVIALDDVDCIETVADEVIPLGHVSVTNCNDSVTLEFSAGGLTDATPEFSLDIEHSSAESVTLSVDTLWTNKSANYLWEIDSTDNNLMISAHDQIDTQSVSFTLNNGAENGTALVNVIDQNINQTLSKVVFLGAGVFAESDTGRYEVSDSQTDLTLYANTEGGDNASTYQWTVSNDAVVSLSRDQGSSVVLSRVSGNDADLTASLTLTDTANNLSRSYIITNVASSLEPVDASQASAWNIQGFTNLNIDTPKPIIQWAFKVQDRYTGLGVNDLTLDDLVIMENDQQVSPTESFLELDKLSTADNFSFNFRTVLMLDVSSSVTDSDLEAMKSAVRELIQDPDTGDSKLSPHQTVSIATFDSQVDLLVPFTSNLENLLSGLNNITLGTASTNLYGAITSGLSQWQDTASLNTVEKGALIIITDGQDTAGLVSEENAINDARGKDVFAIAIGDEVDTAALARIAGEERVFTSSFSDISSTLDQTKSSAVSIDDGLYLLSYVTPKRAGSHVLSVIALDQVSCSDPVADEIVPADIATVAGCSDAVMLDFSAANLEDITPELAVNGGSYVADGDLTLAVETRWTHKTANYLWELVSIDEGVNVTEFSDSETRSVAFSLQDGVSGGTAIIKVTDVNLNESITRSVSLGDIGVFAQSSTGSFEVSAQSSVIELTADTVGGAEQAIYFWSIDDTSAVRLSSNSGNQVLITRLASSSVDTSISLTLTDTANGFTQRYDIVNRATALGTSQFTVGGVITGIDTPDIIDGRLNVSLNALETLELDGSSNEFVFNHKLADNESYDVTMADTNTKFNCQVINGSGLVAGDDVSHIEVRCSDTAWKIQGKSNTIRNGIFDIEMTPPSPVVNWAFRVVNRYTGLGANDITLNNLQVLENSQELSERESFLALERLNFNFAIMLDISSSVTLDEIEIMKDAVRSWIQDPLTGESRLDSQRTISIHTFDSKLETIISATNDVASLIQAIESISFGSASTNLYGAIEDGLQELQDQSNVDAGKFVASALILVTDGRDTAGLATKDEALEAAEGRDIFAIAVGDEADTESLVEISGSEDRVFTSTFEEITETLDVVKNEAESIDEGLYLLSYVTPKRAGAQRLLITTNSRITCQEAVGDEVLLEDTSTVEDCIDGYNFGFSAASLEDIGPEFSLLGDSYRVSGDLVMTARTRWINAPTNYSWDVFSAEGGLEFTDYGSNETRSVTFTIKDGFTGGTATINVTDLNLGQTLTKTISMGLVGEN